MYSSLILIPFLCVIILNLPFRAFMRKAAFWVCLLIVSFQICLVLFPLMHTATGKLESFSSFLKLNFVVDNFSRVFLVCISIVTWVTLLTQRYVSRDKNQMFNFVNLLLLILMGMNGVVMVRDVFSLYVFLEITTVCSFILIGFNNDVNAFEAAFKYIVISVAASVLMLASIALFLVIAGDVSFSSLGLALKMSPDRFLVAFAIGIFICALFIKTGLVPFHAWLPDAHSAAPASVSVLLSGVQIKVLGAYTLMRLVTSVFGWTSSIMYILYVSRRGFDCLWSPGRVRTEQF